MIPLTRSLRVPVPGRVLYYSVAFFWGSFSPAVRALYALKHPPSPAVFNTVRLMLSSVTFLPTWRREYRRARRKVRRGERLDWHSAEYMWLRGGLELGCFVFLGNVTQVIGLEYTPASRAAFLVQLQTVIIPLLASVFGGEGRPPRIPARTLFTSVMAFVGVFLLSQDKTNSASGAAAAGDGATSSLLGDALEVAAAFLFSVYVLRLDRYARRVRDTTPLAATKIAVQTACSFLWALFGGGAAAIIAQHDLTQLGVYDVLVTVAVVAWSGLLVSAFTGFALPQCQRTVSVAEGGVILATQPLFATALSVVFLGEQLGWRGVLGGCVITAATVISSLAKGDGGGGDGGGDGGAAADEMVHADVEVATDAATTAGAVDADGDDGASANEMKHADGEVATDAATTADAVDADGNNDDAVRARRDKHA